VQEALTNVLRHAGATQVRVTLGESDAGLQLSVRDNGRGFDPGGVPPGHHGLLGMRYRIESLGGQLELHSAPGAGTLVLARLPAQAPQAPEPAADPA